MTVDSKGKQRTGLNPTGLRKRPSYEEAINYLQNDQEIIKYPNRAAKQLRESPWMTVLDGDMTSDIMTAKELEERRHLEDIRSYAAKHGLSHLETAAGYDAQSGLGGAPDGGGDLGEGLGPSGPGGGGGGFGAAAAAVGSAVGSAAGSVVGAVGTATGHTLNFATHAGAGAASLSSQALGFTANRAFGVYNQMPTVAEAMSGPTETMRRLGLRLAEQLHARNALRQSPRINPFLSAPGMDTGDPFEGHGDGLLFGPRTPATGPIIIHDGDLIRTLNEALSSGRYGQTALNQSQLMDHRPAAQSFTPQLHIQGDPAPMFPHFTVPAGGVEVIRHRMTRHLDVSPGQEDDPIQIRYTQHERQSRQAPTAQRDMTPEIEAAHLREASIKLLQRPGYNPTFPIDWGGAAAAAIPVSDDEEDLRPRQQASAGSSSGSGYAPAPTVKKLKAGKTAENHARKKTEKQMDEFMRSTFAFG